MVDETRRNRHETATDGPGFVKGGAWRTTRPPWAMVSSLTTQKLGTCQASAPVVDFEPPVTVRKGASTEQPPEREHPPKCLTVAEFE